MRAEIKGDNKHALSLKARPPQQFPGQVFEARQVPKLGTTTNTSAETADRDAAGGVVAGIGPI